HTRFSRDWSSDVCSSDLTADVTENAKQIVIKPIQMATAVRVKDEVDAIILGNTLAMEGGLNVLKDAIYYEPIDQSTKMNVNVLEIGRASCREEVYVLSYD